MEKKKLEHFKKRLETRQEELRRMVSRIEQDGRAVDEDSAQDIADRAASSSAASSGSSSPISISILADSESTIACWCS
jgi:RNA polymerase-binding transcription factor DksA